jgi:hypothetical protein
VSLANNQVTIDLAPIIEQVNTQLVNSGLGLAAKIPTVHATFTVYSSKSIGKLQSYLRLLDIADNWLPVIAVLVAAAGVYLARDRRRALIGAGVAIAVAMLLLGMALERSFAATSSTSSHPASTPVRPGRSTTP